MNSQSSVTRSSRAAAAAVAAAVAEATAVPRAEASGASDSVACEPRPGPVAGRAVDPQEPREQLGLYWGFQTRPTSKCREPVPNSTTVEVSLSRGWPAA